MNRNVGACRVTVTRQFGPSLEWLALPELGARKRHGCRAIGWCCIIAGITVFGGVVLWWWASQ